MLFVVEIGLTVWAWQRGWKALSLLPMGILVPTGFGLGLIIGVTGGDSGTILLWGTLLDLVAIGVLIFMIAKPRLQGVAPQLQATASAAGWHPDPAGRHQFRYWDGLSWTTQVSDGGAQSVDEGVV